MKYYIPMAVGLTMVEVVAVVVATAGVLAGARGMDAGGWGAIRLGGMTGAEGCPGGSRVCVPYSTHCKTENYFRDVDPHTLQF